MEVAQPLTRGCYHLSMARIYFEVAKNGLMSQGRVRVANAENLCKQAEKNIYSLFTPEAKAIYDREITNGDVLFYKHITDMLMHMTDEQKDTVEKLCEGILKGVVIEYVDSEKKVI